LGPRWLERTKKMVKLPFNMTTHRKIEKKVV